MTTIGHGIVRFLERVGRRWAVVRDALAVLRPTWVATVVTMGIAVALQNDQAVDALERAVETTPWSWQHLVLVVAILVLAGVAWYFARALLYVRYRRITPDDSEERFEPLRRWWPRLLGVLPILALALTALGSRHRMLSFAYLGLATAFLAGLVLRRRRLSNGEQRVRLFNAMSRSTLVASFCVLMVAALLLGCFLASRVGLAQLLGPLGILAVAAAMWISFGSIVLVYPTYRFTLPSLVIVLVLLAGLFSLFNDNHRVRVLAATGGADERLTLNDQLTGWLAARTQGWRERGGGYRYPVFVVAAEGGGIRAAYWTASVLASLEDRVPGFACHIFAISGVSGGSLGGAVFAAAVADRVARSGYVCDGRSFGPAATAGGAMADLVQEVLGKDFLAPTLAGMLFPDVTQRFFPFPVFPDRAAYLEGAWEAAWREASGNDRFAADFLDLWRETRTAPAGGDGGAGGEGPAVRYQVPSLFLNGTWVETGGRHVTSNLRSDARFVQLDDLLAYLGRPTRLSTAVHMSARFTYVSPAGTVCRTGSDGCAERRHVVDGGYFENSGGLTALEIFAAIEEHDFWFGDLNGLRTEPFALILSNAPDNPNRVNGGWQTPATEMAEESTLFLPETVSPVIALLNTRSARGYQAEAAFGAQAGASHGTRLQLRADPGAEAAVLPLGWSLSNQTRRDIDRQAKALAQEHSAQLREVIEADSAAARLPQL